MNLHQMKVLPEIAVTILIQNIIRVLITKEKRNIITDVACHGLEEK